MQRVALAHLFWVDWVVSSFVLPTGSCLPAPRRVRLADLNRSSRFASRLTTSAPLPTPISWTPTPSIFFQSCFPLLFLLLFCAWRGRYILSLHFSPFVVVVVVCHTQNAPNQTLALLLPLLPFFICSSSSLFFSLQIDDDKQTQEESRKVDYRKHIHTRHALVREPPRAAYTVFSLRIILLLLFLLLLLSQTHEQNTHGAGYSWTSSPFSLFAPFPPQNPLFPFFLTTHLVRCLPPRRKKQTYTEFQQIRTEKR